MLELLTKHQVVLAHFLLCVGRLYQLVHVLLRGLSLWRLWLDLSDRLNRSARFKPFALNCRLCLFGSLVEFGIDQSFNVADELTAALLSRVVPGKGWYDHGLFSRLGLILE